MMEPGVRVWMGVIGVRVAEVGSDDNASVSSVNVERLPIFLED